MMPDGTEQDAPDGGGGPSSRRRGAFREDWRILRRGPGIVILLVAIGAAVWGMLDGLQDAGHERVWGMMPVAAPSLFAVWCAIETLWQPASALLRRILFSCLIAPAVVLAPITVAQTVVAALPWSWRTMRAAEQANDGFHYYHAGEGLWSAVLLTGLAGYGIGAFAALMAILIVVLPAWSLRAPAVVAGGSRLDTIPRRQRVTATSSLFCGLGALTLGVVLWVFAGDGRGLGDVARVFASPYAPGTDDLLFLSGVVLVALGIAAMGWPLVRVLFTGRSAGPKRQRDAAQGASRTPPDTTSEP